MFFRVLCIPLFLGCSAVAFVLPTQEKNYHTRTPVRTVDASRVARTISLRKSLFDDDDDQNNDERSTSSSSSSSSNTNEPTSRKFTGQDYFTAGARGGGASNNLRNEGGGDGSGGGAPIMSPRDQMRQREDNLVNRATSPSAFLFQAASIVVLLGLVIYVGATGQLGMNNDYYEDDYFNYDPETVMVVPPENTNMPDSKEESVWL